MNGRAWTRSGVKSWPAWFGKPADSANKEEEGGLVEGGGVDDESGRRIRPHHTTF